MQAASGKRVERRMMWISYSRSDVSDLITCCCSFALERSIGQCSSPFLAVTILDGCYELSLMGPQLKALEMIFGNIES